MRLRPRRPLNHLEKNILDLVYGRIQIELPCEKLEDLVIFNIRKMTVNILDAKYFSPPIVTFTYISQCIFFLNIRMIINLLQNKSVADDVVEECRNMFRKEIQVLGQEMLKFRETWEKEVMIYSNGPQKF
jgi:hypothetical protein